MSQTDSVRVNESIIYVDKLEEKNENACIHTLTHTHTHTQTYRVSIKPILVGKKIKINWQHLSIT